MKTIKVFLASSNELKDEREKFGNLIRRLDDIYIKRGIHIQLLVWEDMNRYYNNCRKQNEYNAWIRESQIFVALFYTVAGQYTLEEIEVARKERSQRGEPQLMIFCRCLQPGEVETHELTEFKQTLDKQWKFFWDKYATTDTLHLNFVMNFMHTVDGRSDGLKVEEGQVLLDGFTVASMDNLPFAAGNTNYQRMQGELEKLREDIANVQSKLEKKQLKLEKKKTKLEKEPNNEEYQEEYQETKDEVNELCGMKQSSLDKYNTLKKDFVRHQQALLDTAKRVSEMQLENVSKEMKWAIEEFECGHVEVANAILDNIEREADSHMEQLDRYRLLVHQDIGAFLLQTKIVMADMTVPIEARIKRAAAIYAKADDWAKKSVLDQRKYEKLLSDYAGFLYDYAFYEKAKSVNYCLLTIRETLYGSEHLSIAMSYENIGGVYKSLGCYPKALRYDLMALSVREKLLGLEHPDTAESYNNVGMVYHSHGNKTYFKTLECDSKDYSKALDYYSRALAIREKVLGLEHPDTASCYNNIGGVYRHQKKYTEALTYYFKTLDICKKEYGLEHPHTAVTYNNIGHVLYDQKKYAEAKKNFLKALDIDEKMLGMRHPAVATIYKNIGLCYSNMDNHSEAFRLYSLALNIFKETIGDNHERTKEIKELLSRLKYVIFSKQ